MFKKILLGVMFTGLAAGLIFGGVNRTLAQTEQSEDVQLNLVHNGEIANSEQNIDPSLVLNGKGNGYGNGGTGNGGGFGQNGAGIGNVSPGDGIPSGDGIPDANVEAWVTLEGTVTFIDEDVLKVTTSTGESISIENRAWWFALDQGINLAAGDAVSLVGFYDDEVFEVGTLTNLNSGQSISMRDDYGRPLWSGRGNNGKN